MSGRDDFLPVEAGSTDPSGLEALHWAVAFIAIVVLLILLAVSPAIVIATWRGLV